MTIKILDTRVPQPNRYDEYGVPDEIGECVDALLGKRNECSEVVADIIDGAVLRILQPWIREPMEEDLGSITSIDTGFDVRAQKMPVVLKLAPGVTYRIQHHLRDNRGVGSLTIGAAESVCERLLSCGYSVRVPLPNGRYIAAVKGGFEVQPANDNYWITVKNLSQALAAYDHPERYRS